MKNIFYVVLALLGFSSYSQKTLVASEDSALLVVTVTDFNAVPRVNDKIVFVSTTTKKIYSGITNSQGTFKVLVPEGDSLVVQIKGLGDDQEYRKLFIPPAKGIYDNAQFKIEYEPAKTFVIKGLNFETGTATIKKSSYGILDELIEALKLKSTLEIEIAGHTDNVGDDASNLKLSKARADAVKKYLVDKGKIAASRIIANGYGEALPVATNATEEGKAKNRRTEVLVVKE